MTWNFATNPFLVPNADALSLSEALTSPPPFALLPEGKGAVFVILPERLVELESIQSAFPGGTIQELQSEGEWKTVATLYFVPP